MGKEERLPENAVLLGKLANRTGSTAILDPEMEARHQRFIVVATSEITRRTNRSAIRHFHA